ncbi:MAG TPA: fluoride efflux transporter CrcB [Geobacteraceae bacterium]|nr:fluoride efflux transporter CrcB [Geobacteraceae bacterium]
MENMLLIAVFGALGCLSRYYLAGWVYTFTGRSFPFGTFTVNIVGAFLIGLIMEFSMRGTIISNSLRIGLTVGFLGGLTTFSTFSYETFRLLEEGELLIASTNVLLSVFTCLLFTWVGIITARYV